MNNYADLKAAISEWTDRSDIDAVIPDFVRLAESEMYRDLRCRENEFAVTYDNTSSVGEHLLLPENFKEVKSVTWDDNPLECVSDLEIKKRLASGYDSVVSVFSVIERQLTLSVGVDNDPAEWGESTLVITYWGTESLDSLPVWQTPTNPVDSVPTESTATPITQTDTNTNRLLQVAPDLYFAMSMKYALLYLKIWGESQMWAAQGKQKIMELNRESKRAEYAGSVNLVSNVYGD